MLAKLSAFIDWFSEFLAHRKGLLPLIGILLIVANFFLQISTEGWMVQTNCLLHLGLVIAVFGLLAGRAL